MNRAEKKSEIEFVTGAIASSTLSLCLDYRGLKVGDMTSFRRKLRDKGAAGRVVKNTLLRIGSEQTLKGRNEEEVKRFLDLFQGPSMLVYAEDPVSSAKVVVDFMKDNKQISIKGAWVEGSFVDAVGVEDLSRLPGREETLGMLLNLLTAPATQLVRLLNAPATQLTRCVDAYREKLEGGAAE